MSQSEGDTGKIVLVGTLTAEINSLSETFSNILFSCLAPFQKRSK